ncbi:gluconokinase [Sphingomonas sp. BE138]|uniref:gluconokinase n=1 Tax=Sphingomonas sp. BE138 TaxID=2817845 RepID=UPI00286CB437|nr:gluconokinase [Sphingomonas sp. BE138]
MGVSGTGKSTLGALLATALHAPFLEGDTFHAPASVAKMERGLPLTDDDRWPWLDRLGTALGAAAREHGAAVAACSALRRAYRERLAAAAGVPLRFAFLDTERDEIARRMRARSGHYMPPSLLDSQLATLERPGPDEPALRLDAGQAPERLYEDVRMWLETVVA